MDTVPVLCFACGAPQDVWRIDGVDDYNTIGATDSDALIFRATGNYGSRIFDPPGGELLQIIICDACVTNRMDRVRHIRDAEYAGVRRPSRFFKF